MCEWWCVINQISNSILDTKEQVVELSLGYITAATLNKINQLTFNSITIYIIDVKQVRCFSLVCTLHGFTLVCTAVSELSAIEVSWLTSND